jgi:type VI protein secretion system component VasF
VANRKQQRRKYQRAKAHNRAEHGDSDVERPERKPTRGSRPSRRVREAREPDWKRACLRAVAFAVLFFGLQHFTGLGGKTSTATQILTAGVMFIAFAAIGIVTERWVWQRQMKQRGEHTQP